MRKIINYAGGGGNAAVKITLIICATIILLALIGKENEEK